MKRKIALLLTGVLSAAMLLTGCQASKGLETETVKITQYKGVEVEQVEKPEKITDEDVDAAIQSVVESKATEEEVTGRAVENGDTAIIDFKGMVDGVAFDGGSAEDYALTIGSGTFIPGFEDSVVGHNVGDTYDWNGSFPADYGNAELAGKEVVFQITVKSITEQKLPKLDDKFVQSVSKESKTVKEFKKEVKEQLTKDVETTYKETLSSEVWKKVLENAEVKKYPEKEVKKICDTLINQYKDAAKYYEVSYEDFISEQMNTSVEEFEAQIEEASKESLKQVIVTDAIAEKENIKLDDKTYEKELKKLAEMYGYEDVKALKSAADEKDLKDIVLNNLVKEWLVENCVQVASK